MGLKEKTFNGVFWTFSQQLGVQIINFGVQIILARLLLPEDFGLIAMIQIFITIGQTLMDGGMTASLIRTKNVSQSDYSTVFLINVIVSLVIYIVIFCFAPLISYFFEQEKLELIIRVLTLSFVLQSFVGVQTTILTKNLKFKLLMLMQLPSTIIGGVVGVALAFLGFGVWSLVWLKLVTTFVFVLFHWVKTDWKPKLYLDKEKLKYHFNFGYKLTLSGLLTNLYINSYLLIIGKLFPPAQLGFYSQADTLRMFPVRNITTALQKVTFPIFSTIQDDNERLKQVFKRITGSVLFVVVPVMLLLILIAKPLFSIVLTDKWLPSVPIFQILCISAIIFPLSIYNLNIILVKGRSGLHLKLEIIKKLSSIVFLLLIIPFGFYGIVYAQAISMFIHAFVNIFYSGRIMEYSFRDQMVDMAPVFTVGIISMVLSYYLKYMLFKEVFLTDWLNILLSILFFASVYLLSSYVFKLNALIDLKILIKDKLLRSGK
ncbi:lipopolysaccharide biosynthesis protein [Maribacter litoralis]|uniref:lipopolysaccharide biosynthesis protein n=1 Tax=Maribacter litoralis TaxID=2059726 RepID=UPI003D2D5FD5